MFCLLCCQVLVIGLFILYFILVYFGTTDGLTDDCSVVCGKGLFSCGVVSVE